MFAISFGTESDQAAGLGQVFVRLADGLEAAGDALVLEFASAMREEVVVLAGQRLSTRTAPEYLKGLGDVQAEGSAATIELRGLTAWLESGKGPYEIPADGAVVPFFFYPHSQWRRAAKHGGTLIHKTALRALMALPETSRLGPGMVGKHRGGDVSYGSMTPVGLVAKRRRHHQLDIPARMYRLKDSEDIAAPGPLGMTFRTRVDPWLHPGLEARHFFELAGRRVAERLPEMAGRLIRALT